MGWPRLIQLHDSEYSVSYDGTEVRETWYIEPYGAVTAFIAACLGRVDANGRNPKRTIPALHFLYPWCFAASCEVVPYDPRSFSYMGSTHYQQPNADGVTRATGMLAVSTALGAYKGNRGGQGDNLDPDRYAIKAQDTDYAAGAFVCVTYLPALVSAYDPTQPLTAANMDCLRWRFIPKQRNNVINSGLKIILPPAAVPFRAAPYLYPDAGVAPNFKEEYSEFVVERKMLLPDFDLTQLSRYYNVVNDRPVKMSTVVGNNIASVPYLFQAQTLRYQSYETEWAQVPQVDDAGEPNGYNRWLNLVQRYDWRTTYSNAVHDDDGNIMAAGGPAFPVHWNHLLCYPGLMAALLAAIGGISTEVGWYNVRYGRSIPLAADTRPYPLVTDVVPGGNIFDPVTKNW